MYLLAADIPDWWLTTIKNKALNDSADALVSLSSK